MKRAILIFDAVIVLLFVLAGVANLGQARAVWLLFAVWIALMSLVGVLRDFLFRKFGAAGIDEDDAL